MAPTIYSRNGAEGGSRTRTGLRSTDFKSRETGITWSYETIRVSMNWIGIVLWCPVR